jgi:hypothetical protein
MWPARPAVLLLAVCATAAAGCGDGSAGSAGPHPRQAGAAGPAPSGSPAPGNGIDPAVLAPSNVPRHGSGPPQPASARVIRAWLRELRHGHIRRAAAYFAIPSKFQNGTPVLTLDSTLEVLAVNVSLPCGAVAERMHRSGDFTIVRFRLVERTNGDCRGSAGQTTAGAIRVARGKIREWYRLYQAGESGPAPAQIDAGNEIA